MPAEWIECVLADACSSIDYGLTASAADQIAGPRFLRITDIVSGHIDWNSVPYVAADVETASLEDVGVTRIPHRLLDVGLR